MNYNEHKNIKILDELLSYCYSKGAKHMSMTLDTLEDSVIFHLECVVPHIEEKDLDALEKFLNTPRCHEMEEYYWELTGDSDVSSELSLVGMMIDEAHINYDGNLLEVTVKRNI